MIPQGLVAVIGASGRSGTALVRALRASGVPVVPLVRSVERWASTGLGGAARLADVTDAASLRAALADVSAIVSCAHARFTAAILAAAPPAARLVFLGSTRKFSRWPDAHGAGVLAGERALLASARPGIMLHPTMIYGAQGENNVQRLVRLLRRLPVAPLPGGGKALVQPIHQTDVTRAVAAALALETTGPTSLVIAGPRPLPYHEFVRAVAVASGLRAPPVVAVPAWMLMAGAWLARPLPGFPPIGMAEIRRLLEDKAFDVAPMRDILGIEPIALEAGLAEMLGRTTGIEPATTGTTNRRSTN